MNDEGQQEPQPPGDEEFYEARGEAPFQQPNVPPGGQFPFGGQWFQNGGGFFGPGQYAGQYGGGPFPTQMPVPHTQHVKPPCVVLTQFWMRDAKTWFALAESTFNRHDVVDSRLKFDFVLPALAPETLEQVRTVLHAATESVDPYTALKSRLLELYTPNALELGFQLLHSPELGDRRPSTMMETMLSLLPDGEKDGILFRCIFLSRLPSDIRDHVASKAKEMSSRQLAAVADDLYFSRCAKNSYGRPVMAAVENNETVEQVEGLESAVAALQLQKNQPRKFQRRGGGRGGKQQPAGDGCRPKQSTWLCWRHATFRERAFSCDDPKKCTFQGNE